MKKYTFFTVKYFNSAGQEIENERFPEVGPNALEKAKNCAAETCAYVCATYYTINEVKA